MRSTFSILYYINRSKIKADGTTAIMCRITIDGKKSVFATGHYCNPNNWNAKIGEVKDILKSADNFSSVRFSPCL